MQLYYDCSLKYLQHYYVRGGLSSDQARTPSKNYLLTVAARRDSSVTDGLRADNENKSFWLQNTHHIHYHAHAHNYGSYYYRWLAIQHETLRCRRWENDVGRFRGTIDPTVGGVPVDLEGVVDSHHVRYCLMSGSLIAADQTIGDGRRADSLAMARGMEAPVVTSTVNDVRR
jgi:hypothetical protein